MKNPGVFDRTLQDTMLNRELTGGEARQVRHCLPPESRELRYRADVSD